MSENERQQRSSIIKSVLLHAALVVMLLFSFDFSTKHEQMFVSAQAQPNIIDAVFIDSNVIQEQKREKQQQEAQAKAKQEQDRKQKEQRKREEQERDKRKKQIALEEQRQKEQQQKQAAEQRQQEEQAALAAKKKAEDDLAKQQQLERDRELQAQLQKEEQARAAAQQQFVLSETDKYIGLIKQVIQRNLIFEKTAQKKECRLNIRMSSNGLVFDVQILKGDPALCRAAQAAVLRPDSLPVSNDPGVFEKLRDFNLTVEL